MDFIYIDIVLESFNSDHRLDLGRAERLKVRSERLFATAFLRWFGDRFPLIHHPGTIKVDDYTGSTVPDFLTPLGDDSGVYYEVTEYGDTRGIKAKQRQFVIMELHQQLFPGAHHLEINGRALRNASGTMEILEQVYSGLIKIPVAQRMLNRSK